jgi:signal transduction histidine kinase
VADDGVGFDASGAVATGHDGLRNMRGRAEAIGATLRVESAIGEGTRIIVTMPDRADTDVA